MSQATTVERHRAAWLRKREQQKLAEDVLTLIIRSDKPLKDLVTILKTTDTTIHHMRAGSAYPSAERLRTWKEKLEQIRV